jgi:hypothetical protein
MTYCSQNVAAHCCWRLLYWERSKPPEGIDGVLLRTRVNKCAGNIVPEVMSCKPRRNIVPKICHVRPGKTSLRLLDTSRRAELLSADIFLFGNFFVPRAVVMCVRGQDRESQTGRSLFREALWCSHLNAP